VANFTVFNEFHEQRFENYKDAINNETDFSPNLPVWPTSQFLLNFMSNGLKTTCGAADRTTTGIESRQYLNSNAVLSGIPSADSLSVYGIISRMTFIFTALRDLAISET
jgi:hypothetical protein